jgi:DmsE family decaheme c-type cytochrome
VTRLKTLAALTVFSGWLIAGPAAIAADAPEAAKPAKELPKDIVLKGDARCTTCHDENDSPEQLAIGKTRHGVTADKRAPTCENCHGKSEEHEKKAGRGKEKAPFVEVGYTKKSNSTVEARNKACLACHQGANRISWQSSAHAAADVSCTSCHQIHNAKDKAKDKTAQAEVCFSCHKEQRVQYNRPSRHPIPEGKVTCSDCHNPHGSSGPKMMVRDSVVETCYSCHMEKRGPFLWNHQPVSEDCGNCHNPHGSVNPGLLKQRSPFLCQQCHEATSHRGAQPVVSGGSLTSSSGRNATLARGCMNCHNSIHGGSNPVNTGSSTSDTSASRSMRR